MEAALTNWLFSPGADSARANALLRYAVTGDRIEFPDAGLSLSALSAPQQRPFDSGPPELPATSTSITEQYFPRIQAFRRDAAAGRNRGAQYFPRLQALVVEPPGTTAGYVIDVDTVLAHVNARLAELAATESFTASAWIGTERPSRRPANAFALQGFPFFEVIFETMPNAAAGVRSRAFPYAMTILILVALFGSVSVYRAVSHEAQLARLRNDFVAAVSHEFRSPLASILALAERIERINDPGRLRQYHRIIGHDARRLSALVTRLLDFGLVEDGTKVYARERVDLVEAAHAAVGGCEHLASADRIRLLGADAAPLWVHADGTALEHAIQNMIENAAKYSPRSRPSSWHVRP